MEEVPALAAVVSFVRGLLSTQVPHYLLFLVALHHSTPLTTKAPRPLVGPTRSRASDVDHWSNLAAPSETHSDRHRQKLGHNSATPETPNDGTIALLGLLASRLVLILPRSVRDDICIANTEDYGQSLKQHSAPHFLQKPGPEQSEKNGAAWCQCNFAQLAILTPRRFRWTCKTCF